MKSLLRHKVLAALGGLLLAGNAFPALVSAAYEADDVGGANRLNYIEQRRRLAREEQLTDAQKKLVADTQEMEKHLRYPLNPDDPSPTAFEGDELTYDQTTGEFTAVGKVHIVQLDRHEFDTDGTVRGNLKKQQVELPGRAHVIQMTPGQSQVELDGYRAFYRYGEKTGSMEQAKGKVDHQYVSGKRFEFYPDHIVIYDGTTTKCGAIQPDYHLSGDRIVIIPNQTMTIYKAKFWVKNKVLLHKEKYVTSIAPDQQDKTDWIPRAGYGKDSGVWLREKLSQPLANRIEAHEDLYIDTKHGGRSHGDVTWYSKRAGSYALGYGYYEDSDDNWVKRKPNFDWNYGHPIPGTRLSYGLGYRIGRWENTKTGLESTHQVYSVGLSHAPITWDRWTLTLSGGYDVTKESEDDSIVRGVWTDVGLLRDFDSRWAGYLAYAYNRNNTRNSLFDFDLDDYSAKVEGGVSYVVTPRDRLMTAMEWDADRGRMHDIDYYWFHDLHCAQFIVRYRSKQNTWKVQWQFTPW